MKKNTAGTISGRINGLPCYAYRISPSKRAFDIFIALILLLLLLPVFAVVALVIALEGKGNIIYSTRRIGGGMKPFTLYKFRSMQPDAAAKMQELSSRNLYEQVNNTEPVFIKLKDDNRITRTGRFIRNTHLDELPQLINVLRGDMSIVGNRPLEPYEAARVVYRYGTGRFAAPAGITGLWQVYQYSKRAMTAGERIRLDHFYAIKQNFLLDLRICFRTIPVCLGKSTVPNA